MPGVGLDDGTSRLLLLAPPAAVIPPDFHAVDADSTRYSELLAEMQRLRGQVYLQDGAIGPRQLSHDGRHRLAVDQDSWHLLAVDESGAVQGCVRYLAHQNTSCFQELWVRNSALSNDPEWSHPFRAAVTHELRSARERGLSYVEVGGWAIAPERRCSVEALRTVLSTYSLAQVLGGCLGITTATVRHNSAYILRRLGGTSLVGDGVEIPSYFDPHYRCSMEVLRFDSTKPAGRFAAVVQRLCSEILHVPVICHSRSRLVFSFGYAQQMSGAGLFDVQQPALQ
jgi:hypothetical protein